MADNRDHDYADNEASFLSEDDPLAELARIVGYDAPAAHSESERTETLPESFELDLEAELMRGLDGSEDGHASSQAMAAAAPADDDGLDAKDLSPFQRTRQSMPNETDVVQAGRTDTQIDAADVPGDRPLGDNCGPVDTQSEAWMGDEPSHPTGELSVPDAYRTPGEPALAEPKANDKIAEDWTDLPEWPAQNVRGAGEAPDVLSGFEAEAFGGRDEVAVEPEVFAESADEPTDAKAGAAEDDAWNDAERETEEARLNDEIARSYNEDIADGKSREESDETSDEPMAIEVIWPDSAGEFEPVETTALDEDSLVDDPVPDRDLLSADVTSDPEPDHETSGDNHLIQSSKPAAEVAGDDPVFRHFEQYAVPPRCETPAEHESHAAAPAVTSAASVTHDAVQDDWDIADELERAFAELRSGSSAATPSLAQAQTGVEVERPIAVEYADMTGEDKGVLETRDLSAALPPEPQAAFDDFEGVGRPGPAASRDDGDGELHFDFDHFEMEMGQVAEALLAGEDDTIATDLGSGAGPATAPERSEAIKRRATQMPLASNSAGAAAAAMPEDGRSGIVEERTDLAFDAREVADTSDVVEPVRNIDVPDLLAEEDRSERRSVDDTDLSDIEAEFAEILARDVAPPTPPAAGTASPTADPTAHRDAQSIDFATFDFSNLGNSVGVDRPDDEASRLAQDRIVHEGEVQGPPSSDLRFSDFDRPSAARPDISNGDPVARWKIGTIAAVLLGGAALTAYAVFGGEATIGETRVIAASDEPIKIVPEDPGGRSVPNQDQAVYNQVDGSGGNEMINLVSRSEEPVDVVQRTIDPQVLPLEGRPAPREAEVAQPAALAPVLGDKDVNGMAEADGASDPTGFPGDAALRPQTQEESRLGVMPRVVQTSVVLPDGTLVAREEAFRDSTASPQPESSQPENAASITSNETLATGTLLAAAEAGTVSDGMADGGLTPITADAAAADVAPLPQARPQNIVGTEVATRVGSDDADEAGRVSDAGGIAAPVRVVRTTSLSGEGNPAAASETAALVATGQVLDNPGGYVVQIASQPSKESARSSYQDLLERYSSILGGRQAQIQSAEIADRGTFYRVRVAGGTREEATALCERYQAAGGSCFVAR